MNDSRTGPDVEDVRAPWLTPPAIALARRILLSFRYWMKRDLIAIRDGDREQAVALFNAPMVVLAHGSGDDPLFTYGNRAAQELFERDWHELVRTPSRMSALPDARTHRSRYLVDVLQKGFATGYSGIRVSATGKRFRIEDVMLWNLVDARGRYVGQAAAFSRWRGL